MAATEGALARSRDIRELEDRVAHLCGRINALEGELTGTLAELFRLKAHEGVGWRSPGQYVAWLTGTARSRAGALVATAHAADHFPLVVGRLSRGEISLDQTAAIVRTAPPWSDKVMADCAGAMTPAQLAKTARIHQLADAAEQARHGTAQAPTPTPPTPAVPESFQLHGLDAGGYQGHLRLDADHGAEFAAAIRAHLDVLWTEWKTAGGQGPSPKPVDALMRMMRRASEADAAGLGTSADHRRHLVVLHVDVSTRVGQAHMGPALPTWVTEGWSCDATFQTLFTQEGRPLGVGPTRTLPRRLRLAIEQRDGGCRVPGCGSLIVHLHHIHHHAHGGPSETWNLVAICPSHHRALHRHELLLTGNNADDPNGLTFTTASGRVMMAPLAAVTPDLAQRLADLNTDDQVKAQRPDGGRVDWRNVVPFPPSARAASPVALPSGSGDRSSGDASGTGDDDGHDSMSA